MKRSTQKIRLGIVGCGGITELRHLPALRKLSAFEITALADSNAGKLASIGGTIETASRYENYRELIESPKVEAVAVCVPPEFHTEIALAAIAAGKHVFIEKPLALTIADCDRLTRAAAAMPALKILVGFNLRWHRLIRIARRKIRRAELGDIELIRTVFTSGLRRRDGNADGADWRKHRATGGGALFELGVHHFDLLHFVFSEEVEEIHAVNTSDDGTAVVTAQMKSGVPVVSAFSERATEQQELEVYAERGRLRVDCYRSDGLEVVEAASYSGSISRRLHRALRVGRVAMDLPATIGRLRQGGDYVASYADQWRHFADAIIEDQPVSCTLQDGKRALACVLAAMMSGDSGRSVRVEKVTEAPLGRAIGAAY